LASRTVFLVIDASDDVAGQDISIDSASVNLIGGGALVRGRCPRTGGRD
jgi:hypothetical protein